MIALVVLLGVVGFVVLACRALDTWCQTASTPAETVPPVAVEVPLLERVRAVVGTSGAHRREIYAAIPDRPQGDIDLAIFVLSKRGLVDEVPSPTRDAVRSGRGATWALLVLLVAAMATLAPTAVQGRTLAGRGTERVA